MILNSLTRISDLKVIARTSSFAFRNKQQGIAFIAAALRVRYVLEGSVRRAGTRIRVTAQLIAAGDGRHVWSQRYDCEVTDVFAIQDEIGEAISTALRVHLAPPVKTANLEAYQLHLKGRHYLLQLSQESMAKARACFEQALAIDPGYAASCHLGAYATSRQSITCWTWWRSTTPTPTGSRWGGPSSETATSRVR